jgi:hypothetical protein
MKWIKCECGPLLENNFVKDPGTPSRSKVVVDVVWSCGRVTDCDGGDGGDCRVTDHMIGMVVWSRD